MSSRLFLSPYFTEPWLCYVLLQTLSVPLATTVSNSVFLFDDSFVSLMGSSPSSYILSFVGSLGPQSTVLFIVHRLSGSGCHSPHSFNYHLHAGDSQIFIIAPAQSTSLRIRPVQPPPAGHHVDDPMGSLPSFLF